MASQICNPLKLIFRAVCRGNLVRYTLCLSCIVLLVANSGCRKDSAQWKFAAAINEDANGNSEGAIELLQKALRMDPDSASIKLRLARLLAANDQGDLSHMLCEEVLENDPQHETAWRTLSECLHHMGRFDESLAAYQKHVAKDIDKSPNQLNQLAYFRALAGIQLDKALRQSNEGFAKYEKRLSFRAAHSWGTYSSVPFDVNALVSAGLMSRYTDQGHLYVMGPLSDKIHDQQQVWLSVKAGFDRLYDQKDEGLTGQEAEEQRGLEKKAAGLVEGVAGSLKLLLATRSLIFDDQGQSELADLDRLWIKQVGFQPSRVYDSLPSDIECMSALFEIPLMLDTRGFIQTQLPWQPVWTHPSGKVMRLENRSRITYGSYDLALQDLDLAIIVAEIRLQALNSNAVNRIDYSIESIRDKKVSGAKLVAISRNHRRQAHLKAGQIEAAQQDQERIEELGWKADDNLF